MTNKKSILKKLKQRILKSSAVTYIISILVYLYIKLVCSTTRWNIQGLEQFVKFQKENKAFLFIAWHGRISLLPYFWVKYKNKAQKTSAVASLHNDGRIIANTLRFFGIKVIDGSSSNNAQSAAINVIRDLNNNNTVGIISDGPLGPRQKLKSSAIYFASKTKTPIIMATYSSKGAKIVSKSWDCMMLPIPFSKGILTISEPIYIPTDLNDEDTEKYRKLIEDKLNSLQNQADDYTGIQRILPGDKIKEKRKK